MSNPPILLNLNFFTKGRNVRWIDKHGDSAPIILQAVWIESSQEKNGKIDKEDAYSIPFLRRYERIKIIEVLESAVEVGLLESDGNYYFNSQIVNNLKSFKSKQNNYKKGHEKRKRNQDEIKMISSQNQDEIKVNYNEYIYTNDSDNESNIIKGKTKKLDFLFFDEIELDTWQVKLGVKGFERACEKLNGWIGQSRGTPDFTKRKVAGQNAGFTLQNWVSQAVTNESGRGGAPPKNNKNASELLAEAGIKLE